MSEELKFKPGRLVRIGVVRNASAVGYSGTYHRIYDYEKHPEFLKRGKDGEVMYPCESENGHGLTWWYADELV